MSYDHHIFNYQAVGTSWRSKRQFLRSFRFFAQKHTCIPVAFRSCVGKLLMQQIIPAPACETTKCTTSMNCWVSGCAHMDRAVHWSISVELIRKLTAQENVLKQLLHSLHITMQCTVVSKRKFGKNLPINILN